MIDSGIPQLLVARLTTTATLAAMRAGELLRKGFGSSFQIDSKEGRHNIVTEYDKLCEKEIIEFIGEQFPEHTFLAEESGSSRENPNAIQWIIDPLDGTVNFAYNIPLFSVSIAAAYQGEVLAAVIYNPMLEELFIAEKGKGAFLNGVPLKVSKVSVLDHAMFATGFPYNTNENPLQCVEKFVHFIRMGVPIRRIGSAALDLAYLAAGRFDAFWEVSLKPWDYAAGKLLVEEAGGKLTTIDGKVCHELKESSIAASNGVLHEQFLSHLKTEEEHG